MEPDTAATVPTVEINDPVELVLRKHLPVRIGDDMTICMCSMMRTYEGPVYHRLHVVEELRKAGLLRD